MVSGDLIFFITTLCFRGVSGHRDVLANLSSDLVHLQPTVNLTLIVTTSIWRTLNTVCSVGIFILLCILKKGCRSQIWCLLGTCVIEEPHMLKGGMKILERHSKKLRPRHIQIFSVAILFLWRIKEGNEGRFLHIH